MGIAELAVIANSEQKLRQNVQRPPPHKLGARDRDRNLLMGFTGSGLLQASGHERDHAAGIGDQVGCWRSDRHRYNEPST